MTPQLFTRVVLGGLVVNEARAAYVRQDQRKTAYKAAEHRAKSLNRPLVVVGAPRNGFHTGLFPAYACGDVCIDLVACDCPVSITADLTKGPVAGIASDSAVVFCSCVLEYLDNPYAGWRELVRMAGSADNVFLVTVGSTSFTALFYPGAKWSVDRSGNQISAQPVTLAMQGVALGSLGFLSYKAVTL